jgi:monoterpene epsilon-lactone hydrolase
MISHQARLVKRLLHASSNKNRGRSTLQTQRRTFERNMRLLFPTVSSRHVKRTQIGGVPVEWITPITSARRVIVYVHGGAFSLGSPRAYRQHMVRLARLSQAKVVSIDYSLAPEHPYPHAVDELCKVWTTLLQEATFQPAHVAFVGDSAGANILLAAALKLRTQHVPLPACLVLLSAGLDATFDGESYEANKHIDPFFTMDTLNYFMENYVQGNDKKDPLVSPVFADLHGLPPLLIHVGSEEMMLSTSQKIYQNALRDGVKAKLFVGAEMWHGWHLFAGFVPEAKLAMQKVGDYIKKYT